MRRNRDLRPEGSPRIKPIVWIDQLSKLRELAETLGAEDGLRLIEIERTSGVGAAAYPLSQAQQLARDPAGLVHRRLPLDEEQAQYDARAAIRHDCLERELLAQLVGDASHHGGRFAKRQMELHGEGRRR